MIAKVTRSIYTILEQIAEREIEKDPIGFMKEQSFLNPQYTGGQMRQGGDEEVMEFDDDEDHYGQVIVENVDGHMKQRGRGVSKAQMDLYNPELLDELEEVFQSAHEQLM